MQIKRNLKQKQTIEGQEDSKQRNKIIGLPIYIYIDSVETMLAEKL